jgi:hypothetical protein
VEHRVWKFAAWFDVSGGADRRKPTQLGSSTFVLQVADRGTAGDHDSNGNAERDADAG